MSEWVLILTMSLMTSPGTIRDIDTEMLDGFTTKQTCQNAGNIIAQRLIHLAGEHREQQGINRSSKESAPSVNFECVQVKK